MSQAYIPSDDLMMEVDQLDFLSDNQQVDDKTEEITTQSNDITDKDPFNGDLPLSIDDTGKLTITLPLNQYTGCGEDISMDEIFNILPGMDSSDEFINYVSKLFEIYDSLGSHKKFSLPTIGVINYNSIQEHNAIVNLAMDSFISTLEEYISSIKNIDSKMDYQLDLENCLTILQCLKLFYFIIDDESDVSLDQHREAFITSFITWINRADGQPSIDYINTIFDDNDTTNNVFEKEEFWKLLNQLIVRGLFDQAIACIKRSNIIEYLEKNCEVSKNAINDLISLLQQYPKDLSFHQWKVSTLELSQIFDMEEKKISLQLSDFIQDSLLIISGDKNRILHYSNTWYESFCAFFLYHIPSLKLAEEYLEFSIKNKNFNISNKWEETSINIIKKNFYPIFPILQSLDSCTASFTAIICQSKGLLEDFSNFKNIFTKIGSDEETLLSNWVDDLPNYLLIKFALSLCLLNNKKLWPISIGLITLTPNEHQTAKKLLIAKILPSYPYETNDDIEWMLSICAKWKLVDVAKYLFTKLGFDAFNKGNTVEAMSNFSKGGKIEWVKKYSWLLFESSIITGKPLDDILLNSVISDKVRDQCNIPIEIIHNMVTNTMKQTLSPYAVLFEYYESINEENENNSLNLILLLINFKYLPKKYLLLLIGKILYPNYLLKQNNNIMLTEENLISIMESIENKWDCKDIETIKMYERIIKLTNKDEEILPETLELFLTKVRTSLNLKLCDEFILV